MFELRVLNGLHEGAALPLSGDKWSIGNASDSELQLCDNGIKPHHCQLSRTEEGWYVSSVDGIICNRDGKRYTTLTELQPGEIFTLDGVWLRLSDASMPWEDVSLPAETITTNKVTQAANIKIKKKFLPRWMQITTVSLLLLLTFTVTSWILQASIAQENKNESVSIKPQLVDTVALRSVLEQKLREREMLAHVRLVTSPHGIVMEGELLPEQLKILQRMVRLVNDNYQLGVTLQDNTHEKTFTLPFRIIQITSGSHANIVIEGGQRLFVGDEHDGLRLTAITADQVQFAGRENLAVKW